MSRPSDPEKLAMWRERFERFSASSGIPVGQFCSRERVSVASFYHWCKKLGPKGRRRRMTDGRGVFQQVTVAPGAPGLVPAGPALCIQSHPEAIREYGVTERRHPASAMVPVGANAQEAPRS